MMTDWIIPADAKRYDVDAAFMELPEIDWTETANARIDVGDRVFIYQVDPVSAITHGCVVKCTGISEGESIDDREFWLEPSESAADPARTWMRLQGIAAFSERERESLRLGQLEERGLRGAPRGRQQAKPGISALVDEMITSRAVRAREKRAAEQSLIGLTARPAARWRDSLRDISPTTSRASYEAAIAMPDAAIALAMIRAFHEAASLRSLHGWSMSAFPRWAGPVGTRRFTTISGGSIELFFVWVDARTGKTVNWGMRLPGTSAKTLTVVDGIWAEEIDGGDVYVHRETLDELLRFLDDAEAAAAVRETAAARARSRRHDWHNPYLAAWFDHGLTPQDSVTGAPDDTGPPADDVEFELRHTHRLARIRGHQRALRAAALARYPNCCHYCGLDVVEILETAHLIADGAGGAASTANVRLLCANHHTAFDAGLLSWDPQTQTFSVAEHAPAVLPAPRRTD